jgi:tetratricopeptide (TPR) repeat protein
MSDEDEQHDGERAGTDSGLAALAGASRDRADAWLHEQTLLTRLQREREERDERLRAWSQLVGHASQVLKLAFEFVLAVIVIVIGVALAAALWNASHDNGLVIEAFSVPPDLANRGLTGEVVAGKLLDRLSALQMETQSNRAASTFVNNWGDDIKVQIPDTGVSIGQLYRYLAQWLGHETHITGEVVREADGRLAITARVGDWPAGTARDADAKFDTLLQKSAEAVYRKTQPYRYAVYLDNKGRGAEAKAIYRDLIAGNDVDDRAWAYIGLSSELSSAADFEGANRMLFKAMAVKPEILLIYNNLSNNEGSLQHDEKQLYYARQAVALVARGGGDVSMNATGVKESDIQNRGTVAAATGDVAAAWRINNEMFLYPDFNNSWASARFGNIGLCGQLFDRACYERAVDAVPPSPVPLQDLNRLFNVQQAELFFGDWPEVTKLGVTIIPMLDQLPGVGHYFLVRAEYPIVALADAESGDFAKANALAAPLPSDCDVCTRVRARIATLEHRWGAADYWYARAVHAAPSSPNAQADWGQMLLMKGDTAAAETHFARAVALGPRYAEAYQYWGETLIRESRSDLALAKFAAAARDAPNWGRLHLKWGEALLWSGDHDGARQQFAKAAALYLTPAERKELVRVHG